MKELTSNAAEIIALKKMGLMVGVNNVEFRPDEKVTYAQAIKVLVSALGYKELAEVAGGYYTGYLKKAIDLDIVRKGVSDYNNDLTVFDTVNMIEAALEVEIPEVYSIGADKVTYSQSEDRNLLSVYHDIHKTKGIMTDNGQTALNSKSTAGAGNTIIGGVMMTGIKEKFT